MLRKLRETLAARGIALKLAGTHGRVRDLLRREGIAAELGGIERGTSVEAVLAKWTDQVGR